MKLLRNSLQSMSDKVASIKNAPTVEESGKYLILAFMSLKDGMLDVDNVDKDLFHCLKKIYVPGFVDKYAKNMVGYFLLRNEDDGSYEFDVNIMNNFFFASLAKDSVLFVQMNCNNIYPKYVIPTESCPSDMDNNYAECFVKV